jgi:RecJ-like exonuclease
MREEFLEEIKRAASRFKGIDKEKKIKVISHLDADGISAASIIVRLLMYEERKYNLSIFAYLDKERVRELAKEPYDVFVFTDMGSSNIADMEEFLKGKVILILDHHKPKDDGNGIINVNPHLFGIEGSTEISGAGVTYLFAKEVDERIRDISYLPVIGALGDAQENKGFSGLNDGILRDAIDSGKVRVEKGIRFFGYKTRALHKVLQYCNDPKIPGVSGNEKGALQFLKDLGIYANDKWKKLSELGEEEVEKLVDAIVSKMGNATREDIMWNNYLLVDESEDKLKDLREFSTVLNACGRMNKPSLGVGACLGDKELKKEAIECLHDYRAEITNAVEWFKANRKTENVLETGQYVIIRAGENIRGTIAGTVASLISKSNLVAENKYVMSIAHLENGDIKISLRFSGKKDVDLREVMKEVIGKLGSGEYGGHKQAAGALIHSDKEGDFIEIARNVLEKKGLEEEVM